MNFPSPAKLIIIAVPTEFLDAAPACQTYGSADYESRSPTFAIV